MDVLSLQAKGFNSSLPRLPIERDEARKNRALPDLLPFFYLLGPKSPTRGKTRAYLDRRSMTGNAEGTQSSLAVRVMCSDGDSGHGLLPEFLEISSSVGGL